jgi:hypothetical protein
MVLMLAITYLSVPQACIIKELISVAYRSAAI